MRKLDKAFCSAAIVSVAAFSGSTAMAWWGSPGYGTGWGDIFGDIFGDGWVNFSFSMSGSGYGRGYGRGYGYGHPYHGYGPVWGHPGWGYPGYGYGGYPDYVYGAPPMVPQAPAAQSK